MSLMDDIWITRDGRVMLITEMEDDHLQNSINYLGRRIRELKQLQRTLKRERRARFWSWLLRKA